MRLSFVILTYRRREFLLECLESLAPSLPEGEAEVCVVFNGDEEGHAALAPELHSRYPGLRTVLIERCARGRARNLAVAHMRGRLLYFLDDDTTVPPGFAARVLKAFDRHLEAPCVSGPNVAPLRAGAFQRAADFLLRSPFGTGPARVRFRHAERELPLPGWCFTLSNLGVRREAFDRGFRFHEGVASAEENLFLHNVERGLGPAVLCPELFVHHRRRAGLASFCAQSYACGKGRGQITRLDPSSLQYFVLAPLAWLLYLCAWPWLDAAPAARLPALLYGAAGLWESLRLAASGDARAAVLLPPAFLGGHLAYAAGLLSGLGSVLRPVFGSEPAPAGAPAELHLGIYGVSAAVASDDPAVLEGLRRDFRFFISEARGKPSVRLTLLRRPPPPERPRGMPVWRSGECAAYAWGRERRVDYRGRAAAVYDYAAREGTIESADPDLLHELGYLTVLSRVGEELDLRGLHRVHALGFEHAGLGGLILLPSGGGKSTMALELVRSTGLGIVGEESPLVTRQGRLQAFPLRWGFEAGAALDGVPERLIRPFRRRRCGLKRLVDVEFFEARIRTDIPLRWLFVGRRERGAEPRIEPAPVLEAAGALVRHLVVGQGIAQLAEYSLGVAPGRWSRLARSAGGRAEAALAILRRARLRRFRMGEDPAANVRALVHFLEEECYDHEGSREPAMA